MSYNYDEPADSFETNLFKDELTDKKIQLHLNDESDVIEESDIANITTDSSITGLSPEMAAAPAVHIEEPGDSSLPNADEQVHDNTDPDIETSWNVLG